jgi:hypothetical protein
MRADVGTLDENPPQEDKKPSRAITDREKLYLSLGDLFMIILILFDLLYLGGLIQINSGDVLALNVVAVAISFVVYQMKKRIRKRAIREMSGK